MEKFIIYLRTNKINGMQYVGQTSDFKQREYDWRSLKSRYANEHIRNDRAKYGLDNWTVEVLAETENREDAWELEKRFIKDFNTKFPNGYNLSDGGGGSKGAHLSEETKKKIGEAIKGEKNGMFGKRHSEEVKQRISEKKKGSQSPFKGKRHSEEAKQRISENHKGKHYLFGKHHSEETKQKLFDAAPKKQVYQYTLDGTLVKVWTSIRECGRNGFCRSSIFKCCNGKQKMHKGHIWSFIPL